MLSVVGRMAYLQLVQCKNIYHKHGHHQMEPTNIGDFDVLGEKRLVNNPAKFFRKRGGDFYVCCADFQRQDLVLVRPKEGIQIKEFPFFREALRKYAQELLVIPFAQLSTVAGEVADDISHITTVFLYHTTRCGSTLLIKALEATGLVHGVSEPDIHVTFLQYLQSNPGLQEEDLKMLTDVMGYSNTLFNFTLFQQDPTRTAVCYKTRGEAIHGTELLQRGIPEGKIVFLYRDVAETVDSTLHVFAGSYWKYWLITALRLDTLMARVMPDVIMSDITRDSKIMTAPVPHGIVWFVTCYWLKIMQRAHNLTTNKPFHFFNVVLRYKELCKYREEMVLKILENLGIVCEVKDVKDKIKAVFGVNSQAGNMVAGRFGTVSDSWVGDWEKGVISTILTHANMDVNQSDFVLNGTITDI